MKEKDEFGNTPPFNAINIGDEYTTHILYLVNYSINHGMERTIKTLMGILL